jgi:Predicted exporters of the RND superfamily
VPLSLAGITKVQENHAVEVVVLFLGLTAAMLPGMARVDTIVALENMMPSSSEPVDEFNQLRAEGMGRDALAVKVTAANSDEGVQDVTSNSSRRYIESLTSKVRDIQGVEAAFSPFRRDGLIDGSRKTAVIIAYGFVGDSGGEMERIFNKVEEESSYDRPEGVRVEVAGVPAVQQRLSGMVSRDKDVTTAISLVLVFFIALGLFRGSLTSALMPLFVVGLSVVWLYGSMGYLGIPLSTLAGSVAALVIGIGIDYSVHLLNAYRFHRRDSPTGEALEETISETGVAIVATSLTTVSAFLAFLVGEMPEMHRFGITMSLGITYALLFAFFLLPSVFVLEDRLMHEIRDRLDWRHGM